MAPRIARTAASAALLATMIFWQPLGSRLGAELEPPPTKRALYPRPRITYAFPKLRDIAEPLLPPLHIPRCRQWRQQVLKGPQLKEQLVTLLAPLFAKGCGVVIGPAQTALTPALWNVLTDSVDVSHKAVIVACTAGWSDYSFRVQSLIGPNLVLAVEESTHFMVPGAVPTSDLCTVFLVDLQKVSSVTITNSPWHRAELPLRDR